VCVKKTDNQRVTKVLVQFKCVRSVIKTKRLPDQSIDGLPGRVFEADRGSEMPSGPLRTILVSKSGKYYRIFMTYSNYPANTSNPPEMNVDYVYTFDQLLSTLKFTTN